MNVEETKKVQLSVDDINDAITEYLSKRMDVVSAKSLDISYDLEFEKDDGPGISRQYLAGANVTITS